MTDLQGQFLRDLLDIGAMKFGAFRLKLHEENPDAPLAPFYIDLRLIRSYPEVTRRLVPILADAAERMRPFDLVADVPMAASPFVAALCYERGYVQVTPRKPKEYGTGASVEGAYRSGQRVLVMDDLITRAHSKLEAISTLEGVGLEIAGLLVVVDREQGGAEEIGRRGYRFEAIYRLTEMLEFYTSECLISTEKCGEILEYIREES